MVQGFLLANGTSAGLREEEEKLKCSCWGKAVVSEVLCLHNLIFSKYELESGREAPLPQRSDVFAQHVSGSLLECPQC